MSGTSKRGGLSARLRRKLESDRREIERLTASELRRLGERLRGVASDALGSIASDTERQAARVRERLRGPWRGVEEEAGRLRGHLRRAWLRPLATGLTISLGISIGSWGTMRWLSARITSQLQESARLERRIAEQRETLERYRAGETRGVAILSMSNGHFVVLPPGADPPSEWTAGGESIWTVDGRPAIRLSSE